MHLRGCTFKQILHLWTRGIAQKGCHSPLAVSIARIESCRDNLTVNKHAPWLEGVGRVPGVVHTGKSFWNLITSNWNQIVFTIFLLIWSQTDVCLVPNQFDSKSVWFYKISRRFIYAYTEHSSKLIFVSFQIESIVIFLRVLLLIWDQKDFCSVHN